MKWKKGKSYRELFGISTLDVNSLTKAIIRMRTDTDLFRNFYYDLFTYSPASSSCSSDECRHLTLCSMNYTLSTTLPTCINRNPN